MSGKFASSSGMNTCARQKAALPAVVEREHATASIDHIQNKLRMFPDLELAASDIGFYAADPEIMRRVAHRRRAVASATGLVEQDLWVVLPDFRDQVERGGGCSDAGCLFHVAFPDGIQPTIG